MKLTCLTIAVLVAVTAQPLPRQAKNGYRLVPVPPREIGYSNLESHVIHSRQQFDIFIKQVNGQNGWNERAAFVKALSESKIDFSKESLVLIRHFEGSISVDVKFDLPELKGEKLACVIHRAVPMFGATLSANYCMAIAVNKDKVKQVDVWVQSDGIEKSNKLQQTFSLTAK